MNLLRRNVPYKTRDSKSGRYAIRAHFLHVKEAPLLIGCLDWCEQGKKKPQGLPAAEFCKKDLLMLNDQFTDAFFAIGHYLGKINAV
jgi:hypothetical protein